MQHVTLWWTTAKGIAQGVVSSYARSPLIVGGYPAKKRHLRLTQVAPYLRQGDLIGTVLNYPPSPRGPKVPW